MSEEIRKLFPKDMKYIDALPIANYIEELQQENQQLKEKINTYENPEDLTLMFMYCDEKAKDKIKQLKEVIEEVRALHKKFCTKHGIIVFENNELIEFMNNLIDTLNKVKENK